LDQTPALPRRLGRRSVGRRPSHHLGEVVWLEPYPDALLEGAIDVPLGPEARTWRGYAPWRVASRLRDGGD
jgi:hypothetical protein